MTRPKIATAATMLWTAVGPDKFTIRKLAKQLKVGPATIHAHFKGGLVDLRREIARRALADLTPPYKPKQDPKIYLREFFGATLTTFRQKPHLGRLVIFETTDDPFLSFVFAERMGATVESLNKKADLIWALELFICRWAGLVLLETGAWARRDRKTAQTHLQTRLVEASGAEFPTLKQVPQKLGAALIKRADATYIEKAADAAAAAFLADLAKGAP